MGSVLQTAVKVMAFRAALLVVGVLLEVVCAEVEPPCWPTARWPTRASQQTELLASLCICPLPA